jgi:ATP-binding cassette subfamily B (MDR/TAP) protein 1
MGRPALAVNTQVTQTQRQIVAHKSVSSLSSMTQDGVDELKTPTAIKAATSTPAPVDKPLEPSLGLLFSLFTATDIFALILPAVLASLTAACIPPFMTIVVGDAYNVFSKYQSTPTPSAHDKTLLVEGVGLAAIEFCAMGGGALVLSAVMSSLWNWAGEKNAMYLRRLVYDAVSSKHMEWYDKNTDEKATGDVAVGAGGLMTQFASYVLLRLESPTYSHIIFIDLQKMSEWPQASTWA